MDNRYSHYVRVSKDTACFCGSPVLSKETQAPLSEIGAEGKDIYTFPRRILLKRIFHIINTLARGNY